jgi:hypothetical protein
MANIMDIMDEMMDGTKLSWEMSETVRLLKGAPGNLYQESNDQDRIIFRDWIRSLLQKQAVTVTFVKADGTLRDMKCTLNFDSIPLDRHPKGTGALAFPDVNATPSHASPDVHSIRVFDLDKGEWRSFKFERLKKITVILGFE